MPNCPECNAKLEADVNLRKVSRGFHRFEMRGRQQFKQAVAQPRQGVREPQAQPRTLGAGEEVHRPFSWHDDILGYLCFAGVYAVLVPGAIWCFIKAQHSDAWDVWLMAGLSISILVAGFTRLRWDVWKRKDKDLHPITQKRAIENTPQPAGTWKAESIVKEGGKTTIDRPEFSDPMAWHRFCKAVLAGREFSQSESRRHKVPPSDWKAVCDSWTARGWLVPQGKRKAPRVRALGKRHIGNYAKASPPDRS